MGSSTSVDRLMDTMAKATGTRLEPVRDGLVTLAGQYFDLIYGFSTWRRKSEAIHPLSEMIVTQVPDPMLEWDVSDVAGFRSEFAAMLDYLPRKVGCAIEDREVEVGEVSMKVRVFTPKRLRTRTKVLFLHGGGFVLGDFDSNDPECDKIARGVGCEVVSIGYPLSPEYKFPTARNSVVDGLSSRAVAAGSSFVLVGESAGGNLALGALQGSEILASRCEGLALVYPFLDLTLSGESVRQYESGYFLTKGLLEWFVGCYLTSSVGASDPAVSPLFGRMEGLPPSLVLVGEFDPLRSDAVRFANAHPGARIEVFAGMIHGFLQLRGLSPARERALASIISFVRSVSVP
jgi:acetyl esterase/lipase